MRPLQLLVVSIVFGLFAIVFPLSAGQASADEGDIKVLNQSAESQFPDGIEFSVDVQSTSEIDDIRVYYKTLGNTVQSAYRPVEFEPGTQVSGKSLLKSHGSTSFFPPGTRVEFSFEIRDKSGSVVRTPDQEFIYIDNRFEWRTVTSGLITVYYYGEYIEGRARTILNAAEEAMRLMVPVLGIEPTEPLRIVAYNNYRHMSAALPFRSQTTSEGLITEGTAFTNLRVLLVLGSGSTVKGITSHEFVHLLVSEAAGRADAHVPSWLNEGLAEYGNIDPTDGYDSALRYGIFNGQVKPLWYQASFSGTPDDIIIAYGQGRSVVKHMIETHGPEKIGQLMKALQKTLDIDLALEQVYGFDQHGLDSEWRLTVGLEPLPPPERLELELQQFPTEPAPAQASEATVETPAATAEPPAEAAQSPGVTPEAEPGPSGAQGCTAPESYSGAGLNPAAGFNLEMGVLLLLAGPLGLVWVQGVRRRDGSPVEGPGRGSAGPGVERVVHRVAKEVEGEQQNSQCADGE